MTKDSMVWWKDHCFWCYHVAATLAFACFVSVPFCLWLWYGWISDRGVVIAFGQGTAVPEVVQHGDTLTIFQPAHKYRNCDGTIRRVITGDCGHHVVWEGSSSLIKDFDGRLVLPVRIPFELIPGQCSFKIYARYYCNPVDRFFERQVYESPAVDFVVKGLDDLK